ALADTSADDIALENDVALETEAALETDAEPAETIAPVDVESEIAADVAPDVAAEIDVAPEVACADRPVAFTLPSEPEPWNRLDSESIAELGRPNHRGQDVVVQVGNPQVLVAKFAYAFVDKDML